MPLPYDTGKTSPNTVLAYSTALRQFFDRAAENDATVEIAEENQRAHIVNFRASLTERKLTGVSRDRKLEAM